jgi:hypothetical protein
MATENGSVGWTDAIHFNASVHPVPLPRHLVIEVIWQNCSDAIHRRCIGSSSAEGLLAKTSLYATSWPSDIPKLSLTQGAGSSGAEEVVLAHLCLDSNWASDRLTVSSLRLLDHPVLLALLFLLCNSSGASRKRTVGSSDGVKFILPTA